MRVQCDVNYTEVVNDSGREVPGVEVTCDRCGHSAKAYGQGEGSVKRCFMLLKEECPNAERNYYTEGVATGVPTPKSARPPRAAVATAPTVAASGYAPSGPAGIPPLIANNNFVVLETETSGLSVEHDEIIQIGLVQVDGGAPRWRMQCNVKTDRPIAANASKIHGLDARVLEYAPTFDRLATSIAEQISGRVVLGYNCLDFDMPILERQFQASGVAMPPGFQTPQVLDVLVLERRMSRADGASTSAGHRLSDVCERYGVPMAQPREAINQCKAVWGVFVALCLRYSELGSASLATALEVQAAERTARAMGLRSRPGETHTLF